MKRIALKFAVSGLALGAGGLGFAASGIGTTPAVASDRDDAQAARLFEQAGRLIAAGDLARAIPLLEQAVALSPRDAGYRMMLADAYLKAGRFRSAESGFADVLTLDPGRARAGLSLALMQAANGRQQDALAQLERVEGNTQPADLGLAYALAGSPQRAVDILEPAARAAGATARVRQNLALAYALGGDWQRARTIAAQDVPAAELAERMGQWAALSQRSDSGQQIAALMGVAIVTDPGRPLALALATPVSAPVAVAAMEAPVGATDAAAAAPAEDDIPMPVDVHAAAPVASAEGTVAVAEAAPAPVIAPAPMAEMPSDQYAAAAPEASAPEPTGWGVDDHGAIIQPPTDPEEAAQPARVRYAAAAEALSRPDPAVMRVRPRITPTLSLASRIVGALPAVPRGGGVGRYVVQLGAFGSQAAAAHAWQNAERRFGLHAAQPVTMTIDMAGRILHRVAVSGFSKRSDASRLCNYVLSRGGQCWVRASAGDMAVNWATRYASR